jgi:predicted nucleic acid-binding protein
MFLLDTNVISELRKPRPHGAVLSWFRSYGQHSFFVPSVALYELQAGVEITRTVDPAKARELENWIDEIAATASVLNLDDVSARTAAKMIHGKPPELFEDAMIAAIALTNRLTVATRNVRDFKQFGVATVNPFIDSRT